MRQKPRKIKAGKRKGKPQKVPKVPKAAEKKAEARELSLLDSLMASQEEAEEEVDDDLYFMIYCFFKDFNHMREYLQERWCDYADGLLDLSAVSVVTNTAFELFQKAEKELLAEIPARTGLRSYEAMSNMLFYDAGLAHVEYDETAMRFRGDKAAMDEAIYEEVQFLCLDTYWLLKDWLKNVPPKKM